ncbi:hypothetical protein GCM10009526_26230 [Glutamicibacter creatinolyticus]
MSAEASGRFVRGERHEKARPAASAPVIIRFVEPKLLAERVRVGENDEDKKYSEYSGGAFSVHFK